ncbi:MAG: low-specificity L-threonine aldolase, partial [Proteobacteria bacterium]|nr:low-specificity L-threonine aldolase [Pseudomonadota bacterium]
IDKIHIDIETVQTNIIFADIKADMDPLCDFLASKGIIIDKSNELRLVTHLDISSKDIDYTIQAFKAF